MSGGNINPLPNLQGIKDIPAQILDKDLETQEDVKDIPAQWAKIRQRLDIFRISSKCVCLSNGEV